MNSMIRQHHLRIPDVKGFLRTFDRHKPLSPDDWAVKESSLYEPGYLIFCLEPVAAPAGLSSFNKRGEDQGETFRVKDLCVVVSKDQGKCVAVIVTPSAYEFRVLDTLLLEKAMKAILDGRDFNYLAARPIQKMDENAIKALYKLGSEYAKGGSRRTLAVEGATLQEPAIALLGQLGAKLSTQVGKQLIDIGSICHMIFTPEGRQEDKSKAIVKSCFVPVRSEDDSAAPAAKPAAMGDSRYSVDPLAEVAHLQDNYSSEAGNIDLSSLAPEPPQQLSYESPIQPLSPDLMPAAGLTPLANLAPIPVAEPTPPAAPEPSSSFGDFGMGLLSALAPQPGAQQQAMAFENLSEGGRSADLPSLPFGSAVMPEASAPNPLSNMDTLPPGGPNSSYSGLSSMDSVPIPGVTTSMTGLPVVQPPQPPAAPYTSMTNIPAATAPTPAPSSSMTNIPAAHAPGGNGQSRGAVPAWFIMSHEAVATPMPAQAPPPEPQPQAAAPAVEAAPQPPAEPKEDFSKQFLNDWEQGHAGQAAVEAAEKEFEQEKRLKAERDKGKEQRLREYFGEEHFQKYVKGEISEPDLAAVDSWQLDPSQYKAEPAEEGPNFDADIFANAARSTLETNPDAIVNEAPREEITGPPPDPSWSIPTTFQQPSTVQKSTPSFDDMLTAGGELPVPEKASAEDQPVAEPADAGAMPSLSILDALPTPSTQPLTGERATSSSTNLPAAEAVPEQSQDLGAMSISEPEAQPNSLFAHLTGQAPAQTDASTASGQYAAARESAEPPAPAADSAVLNSGAMWSAVSPGESLFAAPEEVSESEPAAEASAHASQSESRPAASEPTPPPTTKKFAASRFGTGSGTEYDTTPGAPAEAEAPAEAPVEAPAPVDVQQPRVRPRDYSSPLRSKTLGADAAHTATPHPGDSNQNLAAMSAEPAQAATAAPAPTSAPEAEVVVPAAETLPETQPEVQAQVEAPAAAAVEEAPTEAAVEEAPAEAAPTEATKAPTGTTSSTSTPALPFRPKPATPPKSASASSDSIFAPAASAAAAGSVTSTGSQDTRLMMNEMTSLMSKLEMQVAKAANKMASRAEELRGRLSQQVDSLVKEAQEVEKQAETNLSTLASELKLKLDNLATDVQAGLAKDATNAQQSVEELAQTGWDRLEREQERLTSEIERSADEFRGELDKLTETVSNRLEHLIESRNAELAKLSDNILAQLKESHDQYNLKVMQRYDRFEQRMNEETGSISSSLERNMKSMVEEIETSLERACEKLKNTKFELEQTVAHTIAVTEMAIAQKAKHLLTETLLPRLNEQKEIIRTMISDMSRQIANESNSGLDAEVAKLEQGTKHATESLRKVAEECVQEVEMTGRGIKTGLEDHFKRVSNDLMVRTREVGDKVRETERRMADSEYALKHLAEASTVDNEPELVEERNHAVSKLASLKAEASKQLASTIEHNLESLEGKGEHLITELSNKRSELTAQVREASETNLSKVRQAMQEATNAIQSAREKHME
ncbi:MAG: hypothetical protein JSS86_04920 [Cyanobacteria bacterium SZAS LIN-2]|nr:hypothetical protein [Cyanobacteria bacterium SZAS LIN-2]